MNGWAYLATVLRDHEGQFVATCKHSLVAPKVVVAETLAMLPGCELAPELGLHWVMVESDSIGVISSLQGDISNGSLEIFPILEGI